MPSSCIGRFASHLALVALALSAVPSARAAVTLPGGETVEKVDFERHVMGVFGRMGCNSGSCHGSFQGKGGFRLSLFGYDPAKDYLALTRDAEGRRLNLADPDNSLLLLKAAGRVPHEGHTRFGRDSWAYHLLREWIAGGARRQEGSGTVAKIAISPPEYAFRKPGQIREAPGAGDVRRRHDGNDHVPLRLPHQR